MSKNIVLLSDGTGNSAGKLSKTNVWRLYQALDLSLPSEILPTRPQQIVYYDDGVGTSSFKPLAIVGGAFGWGLKRNVIDLYTFLCWNYQPGDRVYGFGFSRGAFTIRVLTGLVENQGLVHSDSQSELRRLATRAFRDYRRNYRDNLLLKSMRALRDTVVDRTITTQSPQITDTTSKDAEVREEQRIAFLGLWDSVAAYGLPLEELTRAWDWIFPLSSPDRDICPNVERACHALALDDERNSFHPVLWNEEYLPGQNRHTTHINEERVTQVWFAGMHSNVGGGYPDDPLAYVSLDWIMSEAERAGLRFKKDERERIRATADACGKIYDSRHGLGGSYRYQPRKLSLLTHEDRDKTNKVIVPRPKIHESVFTRIRSATDGYAPIVLPSSYAVVTNEGEIVDLGTIAPQGKPYFVEHPSQAESRAHRQETIWNLVWRKRVAYFSSVFVALALAAFPLYRPATLARESPLSSLSWIVNAIGMLLPSFLQPWLEAYESHPATFGFLAIVLSILIAIGSRLQGQIFDGMRALWQEVVQQPGIEKNPIAPEPTDGVFRLRTHPLYLRFFSLMKWNIAPFVVGGLAALAIVQSLAHGLFSMSSSFGWICTPSDAQQPAEGRLENGHFTPRTLCWASGVTVQQGKRYRLTIAINEQPEWNDGGIKTGVGGFGAERMTPPMYFRLLLRRHVRDPWFKPIARIGSTGSDEYPLHPVDGTIPTAKTKTLVADITARRSGELFLFVNDAVLPVPQIWQVFYNNNKGAATVTIQPIDVLAR
jgi:uncharacterized protein (DUF2235 family)